MAARTPAIAAAEAAGIAFRMHEYDHDPSTDSYGLEAAEKLEQYKRINMWHVQQYAYMLEKMRAIKEGNSNLLDNSMRRNRQALGIQWKTWQVEELIVGTEAGTPNYGRNVHHTSVFQMRLAFSHADRSRDVFDASGKGICPIEPDERLPSKNNLRFCFSP